MYLAQNILCSEYGPYDYTVLLDYLGFHHCCMFYNFFVDTQGGSTLDKMANKATRVGVPEILTAR